MESTPNLPIGYWLKRADELLTRAINQAQEATGLTRTHWQVLNSVQEAGTLSRERLEGIMQTSLDSSGLEPIIAEPAGRGWLARNDSDDLRLTDAGKQQYQAALSLQSEVRKRVVRGVGEEEYTTVIRVLQKIVDNLETTPE